MGYGNQRYYYGGFMEKIDFVSLHFISGCSLASSYEIAGLARIKGNAFLPSNVHCAIKIKPKRYLIIVRDVDFQKIETESKEALKTKPPATESSIINYDSNNDVDMCEPRAVMYSSNIPLASLGIMSRTFIHLIYDVGNLGGSLMFLKWGYSKMNVTGQRTYQCSTREPPRLSNSGKGKDSNNRRLNQCLV
ncbi:hypothetical protein M9H77_16823 [Catharanthus roseus]|uniref:Uncharacterized protein n=1 Tax=Catharanthus roseus TaxID=4058 RepID=A0ACC0B2T9_CATRO|nr:hypothetical protein M9H77_16823 [Catharanthus roseus]